MWTSWIDSYLTHLRAAGRSTGTLRVQGSYLRRASVELPDPDAVRREDIERWWAQQDWQPETRKSAQVVLRGFDRWARDTGRVEADPTSGMPAVRIPHAEARPVPEAVLHRAISEAHGRTRLMLLLAGRAGLRRAEIAAARWDHITDDELVVRGKGGRIRRVPLHPAILTELARVPGADRRGPLVPSTTGAQLTPDRVGRLVARALGDGWTAHPCRHRFASRAYSVERDTMAVMGVLGHSSPATTRRYIVVDMDARRRAVMGA